MNKQLIQSAYEAWSSAADLRRRRDRCKRFTYGDQWSDMTRDRRGRLVSEREQLERCGRKPLVNNLIRQLVKTVVGRYRTITDENGTYTDGAVAAIARDNSLGELDSRLLEEFLISGCAVQRVERSLRFGREAVWVDNVDIRRFFINTFTDPRGWDVDMVGVLHRMTCAALCRRFGGTPAREKRLRSIFTSVGSAGTFVCDSIGAPGADPEFFCADRPGHMRVIELWTLDSRGDILVWHCRWLAPDGSLLSEYDSPMPGGEHPFVIKFYPLTDGEVHSFVEDVVEQQKSINRLIVLMEQMLSTSAKGVLLFPTSQLVDNMTWEDITERWAQADGIIPVSGMGELPRQVVSTPGDCGAFSLLELQMKLFENISGVGDALSGRAASTVRGAEMLDAQVRNATAALADIFQTFMALTSTRNDLALSLL